MRVEVRDITVGFPGSVKPLFGLRELSVPPGRKVLIQGPSGQGKTTFLHLLAGLHAPARGRVEIDGQDISRWCEAERARFRRENVGMIFQKLNLFTHLTAGENIELARNSRFGGRAAVESALVRVNLSGRADESAGILSLGEQQRVAVARVLAQSPGLVLADEPTSSLDDENAETVIRALLGLESTMIVVSHDHRLRARFDEVFDFPKLVAR